MCHAARIRWPGIWRCLGRWGMRQKLRGGWICFRGQAIRRFVVNCRKYEIGLAFVTNYYKNSKWKRFPKIGSKYSS